MYELIHKLPNAPWRKPSENEEEYFRRMEFHQRRLRARSREQEKEDAERKRQRALHEGHCPGCGAELEHLRIRGVRADQCPVCHGVWLEKEVFDDLTGPEEETDPLAKLFRDVFLDASLGDIAGLEVDRTSGGERPPAS